MKNGRLVTAAAPATPFPISLRLLFFIWPRRCNMTIRRKKKAGPARQSATLVCFILIVAGATYIQFIYPALLITGARHRPVACYEIFFTLQNPEICSTISRACLTTPR
jgi:hypothetical protein